ncbi:Plasmodium variant antigen protein Cir/Yir/Bir, putative, partial [Plasmodium chabaudi adami]
SDDEDALENDKLAEYAILWLSYKLNQNKQNKITNTKDFYDKHIKGNDKEYINDIIGVEAYKKIVSSAFIALLILFKSDDEDALENDKLAEYAILWLSYKLNQNKQNKITNTKDFYDKHIKGNDKEYINDIIGVEAYKSYEDIINKKQNLINMDIKIMSKLYD